MSMTIEAREQHAVEMRKRRYGNSKDSDGVEKGSQLSQYRAPRERFFNVDQSRTTHYFEAEHWISPECRAATRSKTRIRRAYEPVQPMACRIIYPVPGSPEALRRAEKEAKRAKDNPTARPATHRPFAPSVAPGSRSF